jgi:3D (Asp-Asp-Asp) domain-containing protein
MNALNRLRLALISMAFIFTSCTLPNGPVVTLKKNHLKPGINLEVRKAVAAGQTFQPAKMASYFFYVDGPKPPLVAAVRSSGKAHFATVRTTAYCHDESDHIVYGRMNAVGTLLKYGSERSAAADWSRYPVGTKFRISSEPGVVYVVDDYGSALVGTGTIDLYKPSRGMMNDWGVRHVDIEVIQWGSFEKSRSYLQGRTRYPHVRQMFFDIQRRLTQTGNSNSTTPVTAMAYAAFLPGMLV